MIDADERRFVPEIERVAVLFGVHFLG